MKKILIALIIVLITSVLSVPQPIFADVTGGINYLQTQPLDDWSAQALVAGGVSNVSETWLADFTATNVTAVEKRILTLAALDKNPESFYASRDLVNELTTTYYQNSQIGDVSLLNDDMWGVLALASVNKTSSSAFGGAVAHIISNQNTDGGWSYAIGQSSDTNDTAVAIMALLEAGYSATDTVIINSINYLQSVKNTDSGWGWSTGAESDTASTAWVMSAFTKAGVSISSQTIAFINSLQTANGSFKWIAGDVDGSVIMTAYAVIALSNKYFPVKKIMLTNPVGNYLRIEGSTGTVCEGYFTATNALQIVEVAAATCNFTYEIEQTSFGPYLKKINNDEAQGLLGWLYRVNWLSLLVGANDYILQPDEEVLWYFGDWQWPVIKLELSSNQVAVGESVTATAQAIDGNNIWTPLAGATVSMQNQTYQTIGDGMVQLIAGQAGVFSAQVSKQNYIRSNKKQLTVGSGVSASVGWQVDIESSGQGSDLSLVVLNSLVTFGSLQPGQMGLTNISLKNDGQLPAYVEAVVTGEDMLIDNFKLNSALWSDYQDVINSGQTKEIDTRLLVPNNYSGQGRKTGDIIFWAIAVQ